MKVVLKILRKIVDIFNVVAIAGLVFLMLLTFFNVILRYLFNSPITGSYEMTRMGMILLTPSIAVTTLAKQNIWVDVLTSHFSRIGQMIIDAITLPTSVLIMGMMAWQAYVMILKSYSKGTHFTTIMLYEWPFRVVFFIAMAVATLAAIVFTIERLMQYANGGVPHDESEVDAAIKKFNEMEEEPQDTQKGGN